MAKYSSRYTLPSSSALPSSSLFVSRRFLPYFITFFLGAFNDNIFKNALLLFVAFFATTQELPISSTVFINLAAGLFILPFFLFSATAGVITDLYEKSALIRWVKCCEIGIMVCGAIGFVTQSYLALLVVLFLMGTQSAFFGPVKYALPPIHLHPSELLKGNAWVETGTFLAILLGTIGAGFIASTSFAFLFAGVSVVVLAAFGFIACLWIPQAESTSTMIFRWQPIKHTRSTLTLARENKRIFIAILAISWFWFLGASYLAQFPNFTQLHLNGNASIVSLLLTLFSIGIALGSFLCTKLSKNKVNLNIMLYGGGGISLFSLSAGWFTPNAPDTLFTVGQLLSHLHFYPLLLSLLLLGASGGLFIVPLYTLMQTQAQDHNRAKVIAANNIYNALFMVLSAVISILVLSVMTLSIPQFFMLLGLGNALMIFGLKRYLHRLQ